jgi:proteasome accessory factor C
MNSGDHSKILKVLKLIQYLSLPPVKTIEKLIILLGVSKATVYRYIQVLHSIGYNIEPDEHKRYFIEGFKSFKSLEEKEITFLTSILKMSNENSVMVNSIIAKLNLFQSLPDPGELTVIKRLSMLEHLTDAMERKRPITLVNYISMSEGENMRNRHIIPAYLDEHKMSITGFDLEKKAYRIFKLSRMDDIIP